MKKVLISAILSVFLLSGCSLLSCNDAVIKVNNRVIKRCELEKAIDNEINNSYFKSFGGADNFVKSDDNFMYVFFKEKASKELIIRALFDEEVEKRGITVTDEEVKAEMKAVIDKVGSKDELNKILKQDGISNEEFLDSLRSQVKHKKLVDSIKDVKVSDAEARKYYDENIDMFKKAEQVRASHILISNDTLQSIREIKKKNKNITPDELNARIEKQTAEQKAKAEKILKQVKADPDSFAKIAREVSDDKATAVRGGELGYFVKEGQMVPEFANAAFAMKPDTISENLVTTQYGYHIIKVTDRTEAGTTPFVKVKEDIKYFLETKERVDILKNLSDGLIKTAKIEYLDKSLGAKNPLKGKDVEAEQDKTEKQK